MWFFVFFKQKTAYEMRMSDWSSDVCSSDLYTAQGEVASPLGNDHPFVRPYGQFPCKDGYVFFGGYTDKFWRITCETFGEPEVADDPEINSMRKRSDRKSVVKGKSVSVRVDIGGRRIIKKKQVAKKIP